MTFQYKSFRYLYTGLMLLALGSSCNKAVEIDPPTSRIISSEAFAGNASATSVMTGLYSAMISNRGFVSGINGISMLEGMAADEMTNYLPAIMGQTLQEFYTNTYNVGGSYFWNEFYQRLYTCNATIEGVTASKGLSEPVKQQLLGEAKFLRALIYFYAVNTYGDVPLALTTDYRVNNTLSRTPKEQVYAQIIADLKDAQSLMGEAYFRGITPGTTERARPNKLAATALLARVYLYRKDWANAEAQATAVISNATYQLEQDLNKTFTATTKEAIWYLLTVDPINYATYDAQAFIPFTNPPGVTPNLPGALSTSLVNAFEQGDARRDKWVGAFVANGTTYYYPFKYQKNPSGTPEALIVLRLSEQYLIRAEARAQLGNITGAGSAQADVDAIRAKALLPGTTAADKDAMLAAIAQERRIELFTEWGHRWFDLVRTDKIDELMTVLAPQKGGVWDPNHKVLPIPFSETQLNTNIKQNPGYSN
ncbi:RagB/SusD family nutrient uptake outer membrane protein [Chitinophaga filiformis]|uniref:RagB/SusD family nutrient uptake outer membrane protein n=1 Tax=Chitinophaga filiformis TaxID=104663 RepID=UPI001F2D104D|nr:RagB/SusD family nutrient uptake outer membrane protein [Chitinophaga filiformis]MCF6407941.1 RagB/SusD family nutrient uptake outer membrane protein [Chitinophaga filiformis]